VDLLSFISDFLGVLTEMLEIPAEAIWVRALTKYDPEIAQNCLQIYAFKSCESQFHLRLNASSPSQKKFTESVNVRRRADKWCRTAFGADVDWKIDQSWNYIWVTEKWNVNMALSTSKINFGLFIRTLFYLSYIIHGTTLKNDPRFSLHKNGRIPYCKFNWKYIQDRVYKSWVRGRCGQYVA
jgi:hypothetical protein